MKKQSNMGAESQGKHEEMACGQAEVLLKCEDIQDLLFAYMSRELGDIQSSVVREHIRKCDACRAEASEIEATLAALHQSSGAGVLESVRLTDERRARILRAVFHPVIDWIDVHHRMVSLALALFVLVLAFVALWNFKPWKREPVEEGIPIWQMFKSGELPELVERERAKAAMALEAGAGASTGAAEGKQKSEATVSE
jgi:hypothetical protein